MRATMMLASSFFVQLVWAQTAVAEIPSASPARPYRSQQRAHAMLNNAEARRGRHLSVDDQLNILKLGFIPASKPRDVLDRKDTAQFSRGGSVGGGRSRSNFPPLAFASTVAFLAGYSDVICLRKFQCYTAMMSGNVVLMSVALAERKWSEAMGRISLIGSYFLGAAGVRAIELMHQRRKESETKSNGHLTIIAPIVAAIFAVASKAVATVNSESPKRKLALLAFGYGMVYGSANRALNATITQLMTGHITRLGAAVSDRFVGPARQWNKGSVLSVCILGSFVVGGASGIQSLPMLPKEFPFFAVLGIVYALVLALYGESKQ